jgi:hypothetical protein
LTTGHCINFYDGVCGVSVCVVAVENGGHLL